MGYNAAAVGLEALTIRISSRLALVNVSACAAVAGILVFFDSSIVPGFAAGFTIGALNIYWLLRIARRGVRMSPEKAGRFVTMAYPIRFALVAALFALFIVKGLMSPWPLVAGFTLSIITAVCTMIYFAREESFNA
ncbi:MAG: ATP synthase subunit I [Deltaproteobacteria bacterium]|nr:ATP synthase subunit I [Deltaproteobacteria bacterium]